MKIAVVCDWLILYAGAERVLEQILRLYPTADLFCLVDFLPEDQRGFIMGKTTHTSFIQNLPRVKKNYRSYLPFMPLAIEQLDVTGYDLVISSSHAVAKGILTGPDQLHISYVHSPIRYAWDLQHQYLEEANLKRGVKGWIAKIILHYIRLWDSRTANGVDCYIANSNFIARRIWKVYGRDAAVIYPPVDINTYELCEAKEDFYLTASRMVPYKKIRLIVEAFNEMPEKKLIVIGDGPEYDKIYKIAKDNITLLGYQPFPVLKEKMQKAKAFVFAAEEDFGITPVEAQACGTPVIAYGKGGALETIITSVGKETGLFFYEQSVQALKKAVIDFEYISKKEIYFNCRKNAERFSQERFLVEFQQYVQNQIKKHKLDL